MKTITIASAFILAFSWVTAGVTAECGNRAADIVFVLDGSSSIYPLNFDKMVEFVRNTVRHFRISPTETRVGLVTFSNHVHVQFTPASYSTRDALLTSGLGQISQPTGETRTDRAIQRVRTLFRSHNRASVPKIAVFITDGGSDFPAETLREASLAHQEGIIAFAIGVGDSVVQSELEAVASSSEYVHNVDNFDGLNTIQGLLALQACTAESIPEPTAETETTGVVDTESDTLISTEYNDCAKKATDIVFVLDASGSIHPDDFQLQLAFVNGIISSFEVSHETARFGVMTFGTNVTKHIQFHNHQQLIPMKRAISRIVQRKGVTNTHLALELMRSDYFQHSYRSGHAKIAIVITDGISQNTTATVMEADSARLEGITLFAVGVGNHVDIQELSGIANTPTQDHVFTVSNYSSLQHIKSELTAQTCGVTTAVQTTTRSTTTSTSTPKPTPEEVMHADQSRSCDNGPVDIVFAMPSDLDTLSTAHSLNFIRSLTYSLRIGHEKIHIGLVPKDCSSSPGFELSIGQDIYTLRNVLDVNRYTTANTAAQIKRMRENSFQSVNGGRPDAKRIGVLIVDKASYDVAESLAEAERAKDQADIEIFVIAVGGGVPDSEVNDMASKPNDKHVLRVEGFCDLLSINLQLIRRLCVATTAEKDDSISLPKAN